MQQPPHPAAELHQERLVQAQLRTDLLDVRVGGDVAGDHRGRISRGQEQEREHEQRDYRHDDERRAQAAEDVDDHVARDGWRPHFFSTFQRKVTGATITPERFER